MDVFSRRIVGWAMATHLRTELVLEALNLATVAAPPSWRDSSFGPGQSVHLNRVRPAVRTSRRAALDGFGGRLREIASTMPCARVSSLHSNANYSTAATSKPRSKRAWRSSSSSKAATIPTAVIRHSTTIHQSTTKGFIKHSLPQAQHRPPKRGSSKLERFLKTAGLPP